MPSMPQPIPHPPLTRLVKGMPGSLTPLEAADIASQGWNLLREDLNLPVCVIRQSAMQHNSRWMQRLLAQHQALFAPHGKTTMSPELFDLQLADGAWGITLATCHQIQVARTFGIQRILLANELVGKQAIAYVLSELQRDPDFDFYCLVDDIGHVRHLAAAVQAFGLNRPLQVLLEVGYEGGRTGCRTLAQAQQLAQEVARHPSLALRGVEGFEGLIQASSTQTQEQRVAAFLQEMVDLIADCDRQGHFAPGPVLLTAGGSSFYDMVLDRFRAAPLSRPCHIVTRSGCYLTHDSVLYQHSHTRLQERSASVRELGDPLQSALEVWGYVVSRPEATKAIVNVGKRDVSHDDMPLAQQWFRFGAGNDMPAPAPLHQHTVTRLDDQHCHLSIPDDSPLRVGDAVQFGISHPCLTFDKWRTLLLVDDDYNVTGCVNTYF